MTATKGYVFVALRGTGLSHPLSVRFILRARKIQSSADRSFRQHYFVVANALADHGFGRSGRPCRADLKVGAWTVNEPADLKTLIARGLDGICTDRPDLLAAVENPV
jgi:hypothetical protein